MKHFLSLFAALLVGVCCMLSSCNNTEPTDNPNTPNNTELNQPANPATFSLAGKTYVSENTRNGNGYYNVSAVFIFDKDTYERWETYEDDIFDKTLSPNCESFSYKLIYPNIYTWYIFDWEIAMTLSDTCTFEWKGYKMKLYKSN